MKSRFLFFILCLLTRQTHGAQQDPFELAPIPAFLNQKTSLLSQSTRSAFSSLLPKVPDQQEIPRPTLHTEQHSAALGLLHLSQRPGSARNIPSIAKTPNNGLQESSEDSILANSYPQRSTGPNGKNICPFCQKPHISTSKLERHLAVHTKEKNFKCKNCGISYTQQASLASHYKVKHQALPYLKELAKESLS